MIYSFCEFAILSFFFYWLQLILDMHLISDSCDVIGGKIVLFDRRMLRNFRKDGHNWKKKNDGKTVKEAHEHLKVRNSHFLCLCGVDVYSNNIYSLVNYFVPSIRRRLFLAPYLFAFSRL